MTESSRARSRSLALVVAVAALAPLGVLGAAGPGGLDVEVEGEVEAGFQQISGDTDSARFDEYRDERQWIGRGRLWLENGDHSHYLRTWFRDVGQRDERYRLEGGRWGQWGIFGEFSELPHNMSDQSRTPYLGIRQGDLTLPWNPNAPGFDLGTSINANLRGEDLGFRTLTALGGGFFRPTQDLEFTTSYRLLDKEGTKFMGGIGASFAAGANFAQFPAPVDEKIHEIQAAVGWKGEGWSTRLSYLGNIYENELNSGVSVANPVVGTDGTSSSRWRYATAPDNQAHSLNLAGTYGLPTPIPVQLTGTFSYGRRFQDQEFIGQTLNSTLAGDPRLVPSRDDLDGDVQTLLGDVRLSVQPLSELDLDFHYRVYDYDNDSDRVKLDAAVLFDTGPIRDDAPGQPDRFSVPNEYLTQNASFEGSYRVLENTTLGFGWEWEQWQRSSDREVRKTDQQGPNLRVDYLATQWAQVHANYSFLTRRRSDYRPFAYVKASSNPALVPAASDEVFPELRKFPQADSYQHLANLIVQLQPRDDLEVGLQAGANVTDYSRSDFGLTNDEYWNLGADLSYSPFEWLTFSAYYTYDRGLARQKSRQRPPDDPGNNWSTRTTEWAHNAGLDVFVRLIPDTLDAELRFDYQQGKVRTHSGGNNTNAVNFPTVKNSLMLLGTTLSYHLDEHLTFKAGYRLERFQQRDFQFDGIEPYSPSIAPTSIFLGNELSDYRAHIYAISAVYEF